MSQETNKNKIKDYIDSLKITIGNQLNFVSQYPTEHEKLIEIQIYKLENRIKKAKDHVYKEQSYEHVSELSSDQYCMY